MELLLLLCCFFVSVNGVSSLNSDGSALLSLLKHWDFVPPSISSSWNFSDSTPCSWFGVQCDDSSFSPNVISLQLPGLGISGQLGPEISKLSHLQALDLSNNSLSGEIPPLLGTNCRLLKSLDLSTNAFTGQIPDSFKFLQRLSFLYLYSNSLSGELPESLFQISSLQKVYLHMNNFSGSIPGNVGDLSEVLELWLYGNRLTGTIPESIGNCSKLQTLYLNDNLLEGVLPSSLTNLKSLVYLYLYQNNFQGRIPFGFGNCRNLSVLDLSNNGFSGSIPPDLGNCSSLTTLVIIGSNLRGNIPSSLGLLSQLSKLDLSDNQLSGRIPPELGNCKSLTTLKLYSNQLVGEIPGELGKLSNLQDLELFSNRLNGEIPVAIWRIPSLKFLLVYNNSLSGELPLEMTELKQLKNISLFGNRFSGEIPQGLGINSSLLELDFTNNKFTGKIPPNLCSGKRLWVLNLGKNQLQGSIPSDVGQCQTLWRLILRENNLTGSLPEFAENPNLDHIDFSKNTLSGSISPSLGNCSSVTYIDFSVNGFTGSIPPELGKLVKLEFLDLSSNQLTGLLPSQLSNCYHLGRFDVGFNSLNGSIPSSLKNWTKLSTLSLQENRFTGGIPLFISELKMLTELQMGGNMLGGQIPPNIGSLQDLQYALNLSSNQLTGVIPSGLGNLIKLEQLDISNNNLTGSLDALNRIHALIMINISRNSFTGPIPDTMMSLLESSPSLFSGNPGLCVDCTSSKCIENGPFRSCGGHSKDRKGLGKVEITIIVLCSVVAVAALILAVARVFSSHQRRKQDIEIAAEEGPASLLGRVMEATENLNDKYIIGRGSHGTVYKASLKDGAVFAVKRIAFAECKGGNKSMIREIQTVGKIRHRNLIRLEGFWLRKEYGLLLYSFMENGSLGDVLHGPNAPLNLEWTVRFRIATGIANALEYLHYDCNPPIVHRDIKPENILLDADMEAHISDFGIAKLLEHQCSSSGNTTSVIGTIGYIAPENALTIWKSQESDVYSFGVVLLELLTRKKALDPLFPDRTDIVGWCRSIWRNTQDIGKIADEGLAEEFYDSNIMINVTNVFLLALRCTEYEPSKRPTMRDVVKELARQHLTAKPARICSTGLGCRDQKYVQSIV